MTPPVALTAPATQPEAEPARHPPILLSPPELAGPEFRGVIEALASNWVAPVGPLIGRFEAALAAATGFGHAVATSSCTAALHLGCRLLGVGPGDEVWAPTLTFIASVAPALQQGARVRDNLWAFEGKLRQIGGCGRSWKLLQCLPCMHPVSGHGGILMC